MMEQEDKDRLTRVETKLDMVLPHIKMVVDHDRDISFVRRSIKGIWALIGLLALFFGNKH